MEDVSLPPYILVKPDFFAYVTVTSRNGEKKHQLIQTISRVNRKHPGKEYGMIIDYIGIRENMREAMKVYGGDSSVAPSADDVEQATGVFREELTILAYIRTASTFLVGAFLCFKLKL